MPVSRPPEARIPAHVERALITLTTKMQHCIERLDSMERRVEELTDAAMHAPSHSDVLEVRLHSAKLAAELARATVELRGEIGMANEAHRAAARAARNATESEARVSLPVDVEIEKAKPVDPSQTEEESTRRLHGNWTQSA